MNLIRKKTTAEERQNEGEKRMESIFDLPLESAAVRVSRRDDRGRLSMLGLLPLADLTNADDLISTIQERWGGGRFFLLPTVDGRKSGKGFPLELAGEPKQEKRKQADEGETQTERKSRKSELEKEIEELKAKIQERDIEDRIAKRIEEKVAAMIPSQERPGETLKNISEVWRNLQSTVPQYDPVKQLRDMADLFAGISGMSRAPVEVGGRGGGRGTTFLGNLFGSAIEQVGLGLMNKYMQQGPGLANPGIPALQGSQQSLVASVPGISQGSAAPASSGFSGPGNPSGGFSGVQSQTSTGAAMPSDFGLWSLGLDPVVILRTMISQRAEVERISYLVVVILDYLIRVVPPDSPLGGYIKGFLQYTEGNFDRFVPAIPELRELQQKDPAYFLKLRGEVIEAVKGYYRDLSTAEAETSRPAEKAGQQEPAAGPADQGVGVEAREAEKERSVENAQENTN